MVSWAQDGIVSGYSPTAEEYRKNNFFLASNGVVDLNGVSRLQRYLQPQQIDPTNRIHAEVRLTFVSGDFAAGTRDYLGALMYLARESDIGAVPTTVQQIIDNAAAVYVPAAGYDYNNTNYDNGNYTASPGTFNFYFDGLKPIFGTQIPPNTKYWVAVVPAYFSNTNSTPVPYLASTLGRAISLWSNRTPTKPVITAPANNASFAPGSTFTLTYDPNDPDALTPDGSNGANADLAGVQIQYAPPVSPDNPNPTWMDLPRVNADGDTAAMSWYIRYSEHGLVGDLSLLTARGSTITCGTDTIAPGNGVLPGGTWQLRVRTFDYGHPYPNFYRPAGFTSSGLLYPDNMPSTLVSPWSDPITVVVPSQVSPPQLIAPVDNIAVQEDTTVRLSWKHRSAFVTPLSQMAREVQIKRVVDPTWVTVGAGPSSQQYLDLPATYVAPPDVPDHEYLADGGFEGGTVDGWFLRDWFGDLNGSQAMANTNNASNAHSGNRYLNLTNDGGGAATPAFSKVVTLDPSHDVFDFTGCIFPVTALDYGLFFRVEWLDASGVPLPVGDQPVQTGRAMADDPWTVNTWVSFSERVELPPPAAVKARLSIYGFGLGSSVYEGTRIDDVSFIGRSTSNTDSFTMDATNRYEWRVRTRDTDGVWSTYSPSEKFWIVPTPASGSVRPIPSGTIDGATLGCGKHTVDIYRRGGKDHVGTLRGITHVDWSRKRDDISDSKIVIQDWDIDCGNLLSELQTWAYEVVIHRDNGYSNDRVFEGPITLLTYETDKVTIQAKDVMAYAYRRIIKQAMSDSGNSATAGTTVVDRARRVLQNVFAPDDPNVLAYLKVLAQEDDAKQYRSTPAYSRTAFEEIDDMAANAGLDYTTVGRSILLWGTKHRIGTLPEFKDADFAEAPIVSEYGMSMANRYVVSNGNGVWGEATRLDASGNDPTYGLVEMLSSTWASDSTEDSGTYTNEGLQTVIESFEGFAERSIADRYPPPVVVRLPDNTSLQPSAVVSIQHLVPGVVIPLRSNSTLRTVVQNQKLDSVTVTEEAGKETVQITMSPFTRDDAGTGEEVEV